MIKDKSIYKNKGYKHKIVIYFIVFALLIIFFGKAFFVESDYFLLYLYGATVTFVPLVTFLLKKGGGLTILCAFNALFKNIKIKNLIKNYFIRNSFLSDFFVEPKQKQKYKIFYFNYFLPIIIIF